MTLLTPRLFCRQQQGKLADLRQNVLSRSSLLFAHFPRSWVAPRGTYAFQNQRSPMVEAGVAARGASGEASQDARLIFPWPNKGLCGTYGNLLKPTKW